MPKARLMILDGSSLLFRAFYALPPLTAPTGEYTNAIHGFCNMLLKMLGDYKPDAMVVAFDKSRTTFRTALYGAYKGTRGETPEEFSAQVPLLAALLTAWGVPFIEMDDYEADDIIGTIAAHAAADGGYETLIVTGDRDALQLVCDDVNVLYTKRGISDIVRYDVQTFTAEYGFAPKTLIDCKGLMGDTSDNIPGVPGIGPKTAKKLLVEYGSVEGVYAHLDALKGKKLVENLRANEASAYLSKKLATIVCDVPMDVDFASYRITPDREAAAAFFRRYGMQAVQKNFDKLYGAGSPQGEADAAQMSAVPSASIEYTAADDTAAADAVVRAVREAGCGAFAAVYEGCVPRRTMTALAVTAGGAVCLAVRGTAAWDVLTAAVFAPDIAWTTADSKSFCHAGGTVPPTLLDVLVAAYLLPEGVGKTDDDTVRALCAAYAPQMTDADVHAAGNARTDTEKTAAAAPVSPAAEMSLFDEPEVGADAAASALSDEDAARLAWRAAAFFALRAPLTDALRDGGLQSLFDTAERPLVPVLAAMERAGIAVNRTRLAEKGAVVGHTIAALEQEIYTLAGHPFNVQSPKQLGTVLFDELGLPAQKKTKTGGYSTNVEVLETLHDAHPIIGKLLAYRMWAKLKSTYLDGIEPLISDATGRVHTQFNQLVTATGRLSSSEPNLQNIPVRTEEGRTIRELFEPGEGYDYLLSADYSQIELRILAHLSQDRNFLTAFRENDDVHARTASEVFGVPLAEVTGEQRRRAKAVNFGIVYGISDFGLSRDLGISRQEAAQYIDSYFEKCPGVKAFIDKCVEDAHKTGEAVTIYGRRRALPEIHSRNFNRRSLAERMAMNTPIQGAAADIIKLAMIAVHEKLAASGCKSRILLQVHDELVLEVTEAERETVAALVKETMEHIVPLDVPLQVDVHYGKNWAEAK